MSALAAHAQAARILADVWGEEFATQTDDHLCCLAGMLSSGYRRAAARMEQAIRDEIAAHPAGCTIDHSSIKTPKCAACGAPRG